MSPSQAQMTTGPVVRASAACCGANGITAELIALRGKPDPGEPPVLAENDAAATGIGLMVKPFALGRHPR